MDVTALISGGLHTHDRGAPVTKTIKTDSANLRPANLVYHQAAHHPQRITYHAPAALRAVAMALERPGHIICGLSALAVFGLPFFADSCDTTLFWKVRKTEPPTQFTPHVLREPNGEWWTVTFQGLSLRISPPDLAAAHAIMHVRTAKHSWEVFPVQDLAPVDIRTIQLIDAIRRHLPLSPTDILAACHKRIERAWIEPLVAQSSDKADSPKETEMRLICQALCDELRLTLLEQVPVRNGDRLVTTLDLAIQELKIGIMYDGDHHLERSQRDKDSRINLECAVLGWQVLRVTVGTLGQLKHFLFQAIQHQARLLAS